MWTPYQKTNLDANFFFHIFIVEILVVLSPAFDFQLMSVKEYFNSCEFFIKRVQDGFQLEDVDCSQSQIYPGFSFFAIKLFRNSPKRYTTVKSSVTSFWFLRCMGHSDIVGRIREERCPVQVVLAKDIPCWITVLWQIERRKF